MGSLPYSLICDQNINPLNSAYSYIDSVYSSLYRIESSHNLKLDKLKRVHKNHFNENIKNSSFFISEMILEILQFEYEYISSSKITKDEIKKSEEEYQKLIYGIEKKYKKEVEKIWGYHQVKVIDKREKIDSEKNEILGMTKKRLVALAAGGGAIIGGPAAVVDMGATSLFLSICFGGIALFVSNKFSVALISKEKIIWKIYKKHPNTIIILLKRSLEHLDRVIKHGHSNRTNIIIESDISKWKYNENWHFNTEEEKIIINSFKQILKDKNALDEQEIVSTK